jgi:hypothetical protein
MYHSTPSLSSRPPIVEMAAALCPGNDCLSSPLVGPGTPPPMIADRIIRARRGAGVAVDLSRLSDREIDAVLECLVTSNGLSDAFLLNAIDRRTERLSLPSCYNIKKYSLNLIPQHCQGLRYLNLSNCRQVDNRLVNNVLGNCRSIDNLILDGCVRITDSAFFPPDSPLAGTLGQIRTLHVAGCAQLTEDCLLRLAALCTQLEDVSLAGCRSSVTSSVLAALLDLSVSTGRLRAIDVSDCSVISSDDSFISYRDSRPALGHSSLPLKSVRMAGLSGLPPRFTDRAVSVLAYLAGSNLRHLETTWCSGITDESCSALASFCPNLTRLNLCNSQTTIHGLDLLSLSCPQLASLDLSWCLRVNESAVRLIARSMESLTELTLNHCVDFLFSASIGRPQSGPISPASVMEIVTGLGAGLTKLELTGLAKIVTPDTLQMISSECPGLDNLSVSLGGDNPLEISAAFDLLGRRMENLESLTVDVSRLCSDREILSDGLRHPNFPSLTRCTLVTSSKCPFGDETLEAVLTNRTGLDHLEVRGCFDVTAHLFQSWIQGYNPEREAALAVEALIDAELQRGYQSTASAGRVFSGVSDSDAATVIFQGTPFRSNRRNQNPISSCSEAEGLVHFEKLRKSLVLSNVALAVDQLKTFILTGAHNITDTSLERLSLMMTYVQTLEILDAPLVSEECVEPIRRRCRLLRQLEITGPKLRVRIDSSKFIKRRQRRRGQLPPQGPGKETKTPEDDYDSC